MPYSTPPFSPTISLEPFTLSIPDNDLDELKTLIRLSRLPKKTYENTHAEEKGFGVGREWLEGTKKYWLEGYDWRKQESRINSQPAFITTVTNSDGLEYKIHFAALFSKRKDAIPIILSHGWPGAFIEFLGLMEVVRSKYSEEELPYHLIFPSTPGYLFSSPPPLDREFSVRDVAYLYDQLMKGLGFGDGYMAQGGDVGSHITNELGRSHNTCKAIHLNMRVFQSPPEGTPESSQPWGIPEFLTRMQKFGYNLEHATRPSTIGLVLGSNPISLLCWIGEKFVEWSDETPPLDTILTFISLYWFCDTFPSSIFSYRYGFGSQRHVQSAEKEYQNTPTGYSYFPKEIVPTPVHFVKTAHNLVWSREHKAGGHFAALEVPETLLDDVEDFVKQVWPEVSK
ncbi:hypothetical protein I302_101090 [Kwoniella bestiolae CBS 10118]|uniref:Epoxide hydrolase N-terminal domain-containing protein n=1 Tax=Kwoniella bestiolae CBS 10118 TaxID=1296100 RepID=A0A1B9G6X2_9TREE|nr:hypothetical protein I302_04466 [Kwoniella bestiolae CBS 10118]OCF26777.1 hypothetical protein I302_04466 [Kwoniella bestiolae CBS 10118]